MHREHAQCKESEDQHDDSGDPREPEARIGGLVDNRQRPYRKKDESQVGIGDSAQDPSQGTEVAAFDGHTPGRKCHAQRFDGQAVDLQQKVIEIVCDEIDNSRLDRLS